MEKELTRKTDESALRKEVIDSLSESLLKHELESGQLAHKLVLMKNQIMEFNVGKATQLKYPGVRIRHGKLKTKMTPVVVNSI